MCNCYEKLRQELAKSGQCFAGLFPLTASLGGPGLAVETGSFILSKKVVRKRGFIQFNFCPFCGAVIREGIIQMKEGGNGKTTEKGA